MGEKHALNKNCHTVMATRTKIMKQSKQVLNKLPRRKEGRHFFTIPRKIDTGLPAIVVALYSNSSKCSDTKRPCKGVESLSQLFNRPQHPN